jgi:hypothetical protein
MQDFGTCPNEDDFWDDPPKLYGAVVTWRFRDFTELLRLVADDKAWGCLWIRLDEPTIFPA